MWRASAWSWAAAATAAVTIPVLVTSTLPDYWVFLSITAVVTAVAAASVGVVTGHAGMISLCQMSFAAIGAWTMSWLSVHDAPGNPYLWLLAGGLAAVPFGIVMGIPALRVRGVNLAIITLGFATALHALLSQNEFPGSEDLAVTLALPASRATVATSSSRGVCSS